MAVNQTGLSFAGSSGSAGMASRTSARGGWTDSTHSFIRHPVLRDCARTGAIRPRRIASGKRFSAPVSTVSPRRRVAETAGSLPASGRGRYRWYPESVRGPGRTPRIRWPSFRWFRLENTRGHACPWLADPASAVRGQSVRDSQLTSTREDLRETNRWTFVELRATCAGPRHGSRVRDAARSPSESIGAGSPIGPTDGEGLCAPARSADLQGRS